MATETFLFTSESVNEGHPGMFQIRPCLYDLVYVAFSVTTTTLFIRD